MRRIGAGIAVALLSLSFAAAAVPASALTTTRVSLTGSGPTNRFMGHYVGFSGGFKPARPTGTRVYVQRHTSAGWVAFTSSTHSRNERTYSDYLVPARYLPWGSYVWRVCVHATRTATAACSPVAHWWVARVHKLATMTPSGESANTSVGSIVYEGQALSPNGGYLRWADGGAGWASFNLAAKCLSGGFEVTVGDQDPAYSDNDPAITFTLDVDGHTYSTPYPFGPDTDWQPTTGNDLRNVHTLKVTATPVGGPATGVTYGVSGDAVCAF